MELQPIIYSKQTVLFSFDKNILFLYFTIESMKIFRFYGIDKLLETQYQTLKNTHITRKY